MVRPALEAQCGGGLGDDVLQVGDFLRIEVVLDAAGFFLGACITPSVAEPLALIRRTGKAFS
ncbi:MAG: hypothetical protein V4733_02945 [Verrucomicrobiota bacterium]